MHVLKVIKSQSYGLLDKKKLNKKKREFLISPSENLKIFQLHYMYVLVIFSSE